MSRVRKIAIVLMANITMLTIDEVGAQGRGPSANEVRSRGQQTEGAHVKKMAELDAWLRRLVAQFEGSASFMSSPVTYACMATSSMPGAVCTEGSQKKVLAPPPQKFSLNCNAIGSGVGVSCVFNSNEETIGQIPLAILFGVDPSHPGIRYLWVDGSGHASEAWGQLSGDTVIFNSECSMRSCIGQLRVRIYAPSRDKPVEMYIEMNARVNGSAKLSAAPMASQIVLRRLREGAGSP